MWKNNAIDDVRMKLLEKDIIEISGDIDSDMVRYIREAISRLIGKGSPPITVLITSPGGDVDIGLDIFDALRYYSGEKTAVVHGYANSMAAVILQVCNKRIAMRHAHILVHHISKTQIKLDVLRDKAKTAEVRNDLEKSQKRIYEILVKRTGKTLAEVKKACSRNESMTAEEAKAFGLIDKIQ